MSKARKLAIALGIILMTAGVAVRLIFDGDAAQLVFVVLFFGGIAVLVFSIRRHRQSGD